MSGPPLPKHLEDALADALVGANPGEREERLAELTSRHPEHAEALRERFAGLTAEDPVTVTVGSDEHSFEWNEPPEHIGPYRVLATLGSGGMGVVYLAEQAEPVRRDVALKVIKLGMNSEDVLARFEVERQALAVMNHPGIAKVFDAGVSEDGQPYFVMEYARGVSLSEFCDEHQLSVIGRIHIFQRICMAVQHAHQKGVLHRDLKPANILCTREGPQPVVKIIDFGLARATDQGTVARSLYTEQGKIIGTPQYMSPEQARGDAMAIDTRTDIYSLGVILYQLLSGVLPFRSLELRSAGLLEVYRLIQEGDPGRPSSRVSATDHGTTARAQSRKLSPAGLRKTLQGDLDRIVMKAMAKEQDERYDSATSLAMDLRRYLRHEPVEAGPPGAKYRLTRFVRRYRVQLMAAGLVACMGVVSIFFVWRYAVDARNQLAIAKNAKSRAASSKTEAAKQGKLARTATDAVNAKGEDVRRLEENVDKLSKDVAKFSAEADKQRERANASGKLIKSQAATLQRLQDNAAELETSSGAESERRRTMEKTLAALADLALAARLRDVQDAAGQLSPGWRVGIKPIEKWLRQAESVVAQRATLRAWIVDAEKMGAVLRLARLRRLEAEFARFTGRTGILARVRRESKWTREVGEMTMSGPNLQIAWALARASIKAADGSTASRLYAGTRLDLRPQPGLVPLGKNPDTGLWEFYHPRSAWVSATNAKPDATPIPPPANVSRRYRGTLVAQSFPGIVFVLIPGRTLNWNGERLKLASFFMAKHELTQAQWLNLIGFSSPSEYQPGSEVASHIVTGRHPVESVSWPQSRQLLRRFGLNLPTETQWEYACWGGAARRDIRDAESFLKFARRPAANVLDRTARREFIGEPADFNDGYTIHAPVGNYSPNGFALHDMLGNVEEWCLDSFGPYGRPAAPGTGERQDVGTAMRVVRGGSYRDVASRALPSWRSKDLAGNRDRARGLRASRKVD